MNRTCSLLRRADHFRKEARTPASLAVRTWDTGVAGLGRLTPLSKLTVKAGCKRGCMSYNGTRQRRQANTSSSPPQSLAGRIGGISARDSGRPTALNSELSRERFGCGRNMQCIRRRNLRIAAIELFGRTILVTRDVAAYPMSEKGD